MPTVMTKRGSQDNVVTYTHVCDTNADMAAINPQYINLGSTCLVVDGESGGLEVYIADSNKEWSMISVAAGGGIGGLGIHICTTTEYDAVTKVPTVELPIENTIYLVPNGDTTGDLFVEWIYVDEAWEKIGSIADLSGLVQDVQVNGTSIVTNGVANVAVAGASTFGVVSPDAKTSSMTQSVGVDANGKLWTTAADSSATVVNLKELFVHGNLFKKETVSHGYLKSSTGEMAEDADSICSDYIPVQPDHNYTITVQINFDPTVTVTGMILRAIAYDTSKIMLNKTDYFYSVQEACNGLELHFIPHVNASYIRISFQSFTNEYDAACVLGSNPVNAHLPAIEEIVKTSDPRITDVQINGTSVVQDGVANVPLANTSNFGVVKVGNGYGTAITGTGVIYVYSATNSNVKDGINDYRPVTPLQQHRAVYYGLAKLAGADMANVSGETVGIYPAAQKSAISTMLHAPETVTGTTPTITAMAGVQYVCGEVSTLDITLPASGCVDIVFESGSSPTILTVTPPTGKTMQWPEWFDPTALDTNTTYELNIMNGSLGVVALWS